MKKSIWFYCDVLGFTIHQQSSSGEEFDWAWLKKDDVELMLNTMYEREKRPSAPDTHRTNAHEDTCIYFGCREIDSAYEYLCGMGITLNKPRVTYYGMKQLYFNDPDGYSICLQWNTESAL